MHRRSWRTTSLLLLGACGWFGLQATPAVATPQRAKIVELKQKRQSTVAKRREAETKLREMKQQQRSAMTDFQASEERLSQAQRELRRAKSQLSITERRLQSAKAELAAVDRRLEAHTAELWERLDAFYEAGSVGYVEVVVGASDFQDFVDRATYLRTIAEQDLELKQKIELELSRQEAIKADLEQNWKQVQSLRNQCLEKTQEIKQETAQKHAVLADAKKDRFVQEQVYRELLETQKGIERVLYRLQNPPSSVTRTFRGGSGGGPAGRISGNFIKPCNGRYTSRFGWRIHPILGTRRFHDGIDIAAGSGTTIRAAAGGTVVHSGWMSAYGKTVMINHGNGLTTLYGHCSSLFVRNGQQVSQGEAIAAVGSTGWSTGPHCHFGVYRGGVAINPMSVR